MNNVAQLRTASAGEVEAFNAAESKSGVASFGGDGELLTDVGNARRFVRANPDVRFVRERGVWLIRAGFIWHEDVDGEIVRRMIATLRELFNVASRMPSADSAKALVAHAIASERQARIQAAIELAKSEHGITVQQGELDRDPDLIGVLNGVLDLRTRSLVSAPPDDYITKRAGAAFDPDVKPDACPVWNKFLVRITSGDGELIGYLQRLAGYCLTGRTHEHAFALLHGHGANGKSTFLNILRAALGDYATVTASDTLMARNTDGPRNDVAALCGARLVVASESEDGRRFNESLVKSLTGGDPITARFLHREHFTFTPTFKLLLAANHKPRVHGNDEGLWRRVHLVPFIETIPLAERDKSLQTKLMHELPAIFSWIVDGALLWFDRGLDPPACVLAATGAYRSAMDLFGQWFDECCIVGDGLHAGSSDAYRSYAKWADVQGLKAMSQIAFNGKLEERGFARVTKPVRRWRGFGLLDAGQSDARSLDFDE